MSDINRQYQRNQNICINDIKLKHNDTGQGAHAALSVSI